MPRNAVAFEWSAEEREKNEDFRMPAGAYYFMVNEQGRRNGFIHGCPCGCGGRSAMWFEGEENAGGPKWTVQGEWPKVTMSPSIGSAKIRSLASFTGTAISATASSRNADMRLVDLDPRWLVRDGQRIGFTFFCPCCRKNRLTCFVAPTPFREQVPVMHAAMRSTPEDEDDWPIDWVPSNPSAKWQLSNLDNFDTMTVAPSIDASASGNWHGFIRSGEVI